MASGKGACLTAPGGSLWQLHLSWYQQHLGIGLVATRPPSCLFLGNFFSPRQTCILMCTPTISRAQITSPGPLRHHEDPNFSIYVLSKSRDEQPLNIHIHRTKKLRVGIGVFGLRLGTSVQRDNSVPPLQVSRSFGLI